MKLLAASIPLFCLSAACCAQEFSLQSAWGRATGPYTLKEGTEIAVGTNQAFLTQVRAQKHPLLDDIREIVIPEIEFKQASLRDAVTQLQQAAAKADPKKRNLPLAFGFTPEQERALKPALITCHARSISLLDALRLITELTNVKYGVRKDVITVMPPDAPDGDLLMRNYTLSPGALEKITEGLDKDEVALGGPAKREDGLKKRLAEMGVPWPAGSSISYQSVMGKLVACNTKENLDLLGKLLEEFGGVPHQIRIDVQFVSFDLAQINRLATLGPGVNTATLTALWTNGFGELLAAPTVVTKVGQEAVVKGVTEVIYPTQFSCIGTGQTNSSGASCSVEPGSFQTRETGAILQVVPEVSADGTTINLCFNPVLTEYPDWMDFGQLGPDPKPMKQPLFYVWRTSTSVSVEHGRRVLVGGGLPTRDYKRAVYVFVTATIESEKGVPFHSLTENDEHPDQPYDTVVTARFSLRDGKGRVTGPFALVDGVAINVGPGRAIITGVREEQPQLPDAMRAILVPQVEFRDATMREVVADLQQVTNANDHQTNNFSIGFGGSVEKAAKITFTARNISLWDMLKIITEVSNTKFRVRGNVVTILPQDVTDDEFFVRRYNLPRAVMERAEGVVRDLGSVRGGEHTNHTDDANQFHRYNSDYLKKLLGDLGVAWPAGSSATYLPSAEKLFIRSTRYQLHTLDLVLEEMNYTPRQIQIDAQFVSFDRTNIARIAAAGAGFSTASLVALWARGGGELLTAPSVVTKAGQEAIAMGGMEVTYPTEFTCVAACPPGVTNGQAGTVAGCVEPGSFQTRETGVILQVVPEVSADGRMINLVLNPQVVDDPIWEDFGPVTRDAAGKEHPSQMKQPFFHVYSTTASVSLASGKRVLVGGGMPSRDGKRMVYLFVTATLVNMRGEAVHPLWDDEEAPDQPVK